MIGTESFDMTLATIGACEPPDHEWSAACRRALDWVRDAKAENQRLREALRAIAGIGYTLDAPMGDEARLDTATQIAAEALGDDA